MAYIYRFRIARGDQVETIAEGLMSTELLQKVVRACPEHALIFVTRMKHLIMNEIEAVFQLTVHDGALCFYTYREKMVGPEGTQPTLEQIHALLEGDPDYYEVGAKVTMEYFEDDGYWIE